MFMTDKQRDSLVKGFLITANFADAPEDGPALETWDSSAEAKAREITERFVNMASDTAIMAYLDNIHLHPDMGIDAWCHLGSDIYYEIAGHGVGFTDRAEVSEKARGELHRTGQVNFCPMTVYIDETGKGFLEC